MKILKSNQISTTDLALASKQLWSILQPAISYLTDSEQKIVELAFTQMVVAHGEDRRKSGEFYIIHPVAACLILTDIELDSDTLAACLMHDVPEDTDVSLKDLAKDFSSEVVFLVEGVTKLSAIKYKGEDRYAENLRKMFVAMSQDVRVVFIKLADRLHNLKTLKHVSPEKRHRIALESLEIYAPIAERLGINYFRGEIEDAAFQFVYPEEYKNLLLKTDIEIERRNKILLKIEKYTKKLLESEKMKYISLSGRSKRYYSIYKKLQAKNKSLEELHDLVALRIIVKTESDCYQTLSLLQQHFKVIEARFKDYIARPKANGYKSLHLSVIDEQSNMPFEFQIRTQEMHDFAEYGIASHWAYKNQLLSKADKMALMKPESFQWLNELIEIGKEKWTEEEYLHHVKLDVFSDRIFVLTPKNDPIDLPIGATALDFAYRIHQEVGDHAQMAKVNGEIAKLSCELKSGDVVEIILGKNQKPKQEWLEWVNTGLSKKHIRSSIRKNLKTDLLSS